MSGTSMWASRPDMLTLAAFLFVYLQMFLDIFLRSPVNLNLSVSLCRCICVLNLLAAELMCFLSRWRSVWKQSHASVTPFPFFVSSSILQRFSFFCYNSFLVNSFVFSQYLFSHFPSQSISLLTRMIRCLFCLASFHLLFIFSYVFIFSTILSSSFHSVFIIHTMQSPFLSNFSQNSAFI